MSTTFTMRIEESQKKLISEYAAVQGKSMSEFMLAAALDVIEDAIDLRDWKIEKAEFDKNLATVPGEEVFRKYAR